MGFKSIAFYIFLFLIGFSRIYLGVHSLDQILLGWVFAAYLVILFYLLFDKILDTLLDIYIRKSYSYYIPKNSNILIILIIFFVF